jgi:hypothetical protein
METQESLQQKVDRQQIEIDLLRNEINSLKNTNSIPLTIYQAFISRFFTNSILIGNIGFNGNDFGGGDKVIYIANANTAPPNTPSLGGVLYTQSGALKYKGSSGTVTTIANA